MKELLKKLRGMDAGMLCIPALMLLGYIFIHALFGGTLLSYNCWDSYSLQAMSWLSGRLDMGKNYEWLELAVYNGKYYLSFPPLPSVVMLPFVLLFGERTPSNLVSALYGIFTAMIACKILKKAGMKHPYASENRGVAHKCGHDGHSAALCALAAEIDRHGCRSDILFLFQHAEETGCGAPVCQKMITDEKPDIIFGWHNMPGFPAGSVAVHDGTAAFASRGLVLSFFGKSSHASQPENGHNPARAISKLIIDIPELTAREDHRGIVMATVVCVRIGEEAFGTNAGFGQLMLTIRAEFESELDALDAEICARARAYARQDGITNVEVQYRDSFPETRNTPDAVAAVRKARLECGLPEARWDEPFRSSEDFGCYTKLTSGALFYIGCGTRHAKLHTREYDFNDEIIEPAVDMMFRLAQDA